MCLQYKVLKTLGENEKLLVTSNFSFSLSVFVRFGEVSAIFIKYEIVVCKVWKRLKFVVWERLNLLSANGFNFVVRYWVKQPFVFLYSISMRTADSFASSQTGSIGGSLVDSQNLPTSESTQFEEVIDLNVHVTNRTLKAQQLAENFINHNLNDNDDLTMIDSSDSASHSVGKPIIAFEDNATRRQDVPGEDFICFCQLFIQYRLNFYF